MKTPITDALNSERYSHHSEAYSALIEASRRLERDRAALMDALKKIANRCVIAGSTGDYRQGQLDALSACREVSESALATARANFQDED